MPSTIITSSGRSCANRGPSRPIAIARISIRPWPFAERTIGSRAPHLHARIASMCGCCIWRQRSQRLRWRLRCCCWRKQTRCQLPTPYVTWSAQSRSSRWWLCRSICSPTISCCHHRGVPMPNRQEQLTAMLRELRLPTMATSCSQIALKASKENLTHEGFLHELARLECEERAQRRIERHLTQSKLPREKTFRTFQWERLSASLRLQIERLRSGEFVTHAHNVFAVGAPGVGKSHLAAALGHELIQQGHTVLWSSTAALVQRLLAAKRELRLPQEIAKLQQVGCLILDDIGYVQQDREEMEVLFTLLAERYEQRSVLITTNLVFSAWDRIFKDPMTTLAAVDRVVHHSVILDMAGVQSFRANQAREDHAPEEAALAALSVAPMP